MLGQLAEDSLGLFSLVPALRRAEPGSYQPYAKYFRDRYTTRLTSARIEGRTDLMDSLPRPDPSGDSMSGEEFAANAAVVFRAGFETTTNLIVNGLRALFAHPDQLALLREEPSLIPSAVEEMLRYEGPLHGLFRVTTREVEIGGAVIPGGSFVQVLAGGTAGVRGAPCSYPQPARRRPGAGHPTRRCTFPRRDADRLPRDITAAIEMDLSFSNAAVVAEERRAIRWPCI
jgi:cytochrome P450